MKDPRLTLRLAAWQGWKDEGLPPLTGDADKRVAAQVRVSVVRKLRLHLRELDRLAEWGFRGPDREERMTRFRGHLAAIRDELVEIEHTADAGFWERARGKEPQAILTGKKVTP